MSRHVQTLAVLAAAAGAQAQGVVWSNIGAFPQDLISTGDAWSAIRSEPPNFVSHRCAADDFSLAQPTTITRITYYSVQIDPPTILGGDWYVFEVDPGTGGPGTLVAHQAGAPLVRTDTGLVNQNFGTIYANVMEPQGLTLPAGEYFLAFRTFQEIPAAPAGKPNNVALTTRVQIGTSTALWNFELSAQGVASQPWVPMSTFNLVPDQAWAFVLEGQAACYPDCDGTGSLDLFDFLCFANAFNAGKPYADCDGSGVLDLFDYLCFVNAFAAGCP